MSFIQFESSSEKEKIRAEIRSVREELLKKAQKNAENRANRDVAKKLRGDDTWMHPSVLKKLESSGDSKKSEKSSKKSKKKSSEKKSKKEKKHKKKKKRKHSSSDSASTEEEIVKKRHKRRDWTDSSSSSDDDSEEAVSEDEWVEKVDKSMREKSKSPPLSRDDWMTGGLMLKTYSKQPIEKKERQTIESYNPAQSARELNPYWKDGGTGLPTFQKPKDEDEGTYRDESRARNDRQAPRGNWRKQSAVAQGSSNSDRSKYENPFRSTNRRKSTSRSPRRRTSRSPRRRTSRSPRRRTSRSPRRTSRSKSDSPHGRRHRSRESRHSSPQQKSKRCETVTSTESKRQTSPPSEKFPDQSDFLTDQQMNELGAKLIKAEIMGNEAVVKELSDKLQKARDLRNNIKSGVQAGRVDDGKPSTSNRHDRDEDDHVLLTTTDSRGVTRPLPSRRAVQPKESDLYGGRKKGRKTRTETHEGGERVRYFPDDDRFDIKQMFEREKYTTAADFDAQFADIAGKHKNPKDDLEDVFADKVRKGISDYEKDEREKSRAINEHEQFTKMLENCDRCFDSTKMEKQLIVCMGATVYLSLPWHEALQPGHCLISPVQHVSCSTQLDEDTWAEINDFRKALTRMFESRKQDVVFFETARYLNRRPHMVIHCVPSRDFEMAPFYFKKAIQESEQMWSTNKQLIALKETNVRRAVPKGLPYFWVNFGMDTGFAHVIEDQERFPSNFAQEIIGGLLNLDPKAWRKPRREYNPIPKVKQFADWWKSYDCTVSS